MCWACVLIVTSFGIMVGATVTMLLLDRRDKDRQREHDAAFEAEMSKVLAKRESRWQNVKG